MRAPNIVVLDSADELRGQVERATARLRPRPTVEGCADVEHVEGASAAHGGIDVLLAGPSLATEGSLRALRRLRLELPDTALILAFDRWRTSSVREVVRTGALDILRLPVDDDAIIEAVEQALELRRRRAAVHHTTGTGHPRPDGDVIAVVSATGGCGKTFFATNLAYHAQSRLQKRTCLVDLDLQFGELSTALRLKPQFTISDLLGAAADGDAEASDDGHLPDLPDRIEEYVAVHDTGISVLAAPEEPADADRIGAADVARIIDAARSRFDYVVIDTPASLSEAVLAGLDSADEIFAIATLDLPSVRNLGVLLTTLRQLKVPPERVRLVLNKVEPDVGIDVGQVTKYFPQGFSIVIPYGREVNRSLNMGVPMLAYDARSEVSRTLTGGLTAALGGEDEVRAAERPRRGPGLFGGRRKRSAQEKRT